MSITILIAAILFLPILGFLVVWALKLRRLVWDIHSNSTNLLSEISILKRSNVKLAGAISDAGLEAVNATCLASLGLKFPVFLGDWSIDSFLARWLVQHILERRPKCIVELGSGSSTIVIARILDMLGENQTTHIAVDHEEKYLGLTQIIANLNGVSKGVQFMYCPLVRYESLDKLWYDGLTEKLGDCKIDLLIIDGPPGTLQPLSRYPAIPLLLPQLNSQCTIVLDDAIRPEEQDIAQRWVQENPEFSLMFTSQGHGSAILTR